MKVIIIFNFCVALLLTIIPNGVRGVNSNVELLDRMARKGKILEGIYKPTVNGSLGAGCYGTTYKGQLVVHNNMEVAMKFSSSIRIKSARNEYKLYTYLNAINNPDVTNDGIPAIYYYGSTNTYTMLAMTLLDSSFQKTANEGKIREVDIFIAFREFVRIIKYIHSHGIIHMGINVNNIIIQNGHGFIFDFGLSYDMSEYSPAENIANAKYDFRKFLLAMYKLVEPKKNWEWLGLSQDALAASRMSSVSNFFDRLLDDVKSSEAKNFTGLRRLFVECAKHAFDNASTGSEDGNGTWIPFYDQIYQVIYEECEKHGGEAKTSISTISSIPDPFAVNEWNRPDVDYKLFQNMYADQIAAAKNKGCCTCFP